MNKTDLHKSPDKDGFFGKHGLYTDKHAATMAKGTSSVFTRYKNRI